jgi:hypothetical protein
LNATALQVPLHEFRTPSNRANHFVFGQIEEAMLHGKDMSLGAAVFTGVTIIGSDTQAIVFGSDQQTYFVKFNG